MDHDGVLALGVEDSDLEQLTVRGAIKVKKVMPWYALANNILQGRRLRLQRLAAVYG